MAKQETKMVDLYYLGGLAPEEYDENGNLKPYYISSRGTSFVLPPVGGKLRVSEFTARDFIRRHKVAGRSGTFEAFTTNKSLAEQVKRGREEQPDTGVHYTAAELRQMLDEAEAIEAASDSDEPLFEHEQAAAESTTVMVSRNKGKAGRPKSRS